MQKRGREELPLTQGRGGDGDKLPHVRGQVWHREELPHLQGAAAAWAQEAGEEQLHIQGQEGRLWGATHHPR